MMRTLFFVVAALAALYGGYWFVGERQLEGGLGQALADLATDGWEVSYASLDTTGFPSRFDTTITDLRLGDPAGRVVWATPAVKAYALSYRPNRVIVDLPPEQTFAVPGQPGGAEASEATLRSDRLRASVHVGLEAGRPLREATIEGDKLLLQDRQAGEVARVGRVILAVRQAEGSEAAYDLFLDARGLGAAAMPVAADLGLDAAVTLDRPIGLGPETDSDPGPAVLAIEVRSASVTAGPGSLSVSGRLGVDGGGALEGRLDLSARGWGDILAALREAGVIEEGVGILAGRLLDEVARTTAGEDGAIEVPLLFEEGRISVLGLPLGRSPVLIPPQRQ